MHSLNCLPIFVAVVDWGSFSLAARHLNLTKSAVSKRIAQLEEELGIVLIHRTTRKLSLTEAGQRYYDYAQQAVSLAQQGRDAVSEMQGTPQGKLKVTAPMSFGVQYVSPIIGEFLSRYPDIDLDLNLEDKMVDLVADGFDLGIRIGELTISNLVAKRLAPCRSVLCASPTYLAVHGSPQKPSDLIHHNCLKYSYFRGGSEWRFNHNGSQHKVVPKGNFVVNNSEVIRRSLLNHIGIAQMPTFIVSKDLQQGDLVSVMSEYSLPEHAIYAVFPERKHMPLKVRVFLDFIAEKLGDDVPVWETYQ